jgi:hypothetical protein
LFNLIYATKSQEAFLLFASVKGGRGRLLAFREYQPACHSSFPIGSADFSYV